MLYIASDNPAPPSMLDEGYQLTVDQFSSVRFTCNATGNPRPIYLWYKDDAVARVTRDDR